MYLMAASKKGISSNQLHRTLGVTLKTAWFMSHRIREAMRSGDLVPFGVNGGSVESDETFLWNEPDKEVKKGYAHKRKVLYLIDRESGSARSFADDAGQYHCLKDHFADHQVVNHSAGEYLSREDRTQNIQTHFHDPH